MTTNKILEIDSLNASYGRFDVLHDICMHINEGEAVGLLGANGAGKSTLLRSIMGLMKHTRGIINVDGTSIINLPAHKVAIGHAALVPEGRRLFLNQSVEDNLRLGGMRFRKDSSSHRRPLSLVRLAPSRLRSPWLALGLVVLRLARLEQEAPPPTHLARPEPWVIWRRQPFRPS